jgi:hypothetical protein
MIFLCIPAPALDLYLLEPGLLMAKLNPRNVRLGLREPDLV